MLLLFRGVNWLPVKCDPDNHEIHLQTPHIFELKQFHKSFRGTHRYLRVCTCDTSSLITAVMLHEGRWQVTRNGFTESAQKPTDVFCGTSAICVSDSSLVDSSPRANEPMELWDFYEQINLSVCRLSRFEKQAAEVGLQHVSRYMWQKTQRH